MRIENIRLGHATNSSSSHSIILTGKKRLEDHCSCGQYQYGWENFVLASESAKKGYLASTLYTSLQVAGLSQELSVYVIRSLLGEMLYADPKELWAYVDHESLISLPRSRKMSSFATGPEISLDLEFWEDLQEFLLREDVAILGGSDNNEGPHPDKVQAVREFTGLPKDSSDPLIARKDGPYWVLFNRNTGAKIRLTFEDDVPAMTKASVPELVDLKITDQCPYLCSYCYQNSQPTGEVGKYPVIRQILWALGDLGVFEVALGGGETTLHPHFLDILKDCRHSGLNVSFSTRNLQWLHDPVLRPQILDLSRAIGVSVDSRDEVDKLFGLCSVYDIKPEKFTIQIIPEAMHCGIGKLVIEWASRYGFPVLLLGYKLTGRGKKKDRQCSLSVADLMELAPGIIYSVALDTCLAKQWEAELQKAKVPETLYQLEEGKYSCYIDAVAEQIGPSSFCARKEKRFLTIEQHTKKSLSDQIRQQFQAF